MQGSTQDQVPEYAGGEPVTVIVPQKGWVPLNLREIWDCRELIWFLALRDISARYRQTIAGMSWALIQPVMTMLVFTAVFGRIVKIPADGLHYPVFCFAGMMPWQYFSSVVSSSSGSLLKNVHLLTKVHFPRLAIPFAATIPPLVDLGAAFIVLFFLMIHFDMELTWRIAYLPIFLMLALITALGVGLWLSALSVEYRDIQHILPFVMQMLMFASPVVYSVNLVPLEYRPLLGLNPIAGVITGFRWALLGHSGAQRFPMLTLSAVVAVALLVSGAYYFRRVERTFADLM